MSKLAVRMLDDMADENNIKNVFDEIVNRIKALERREMDVDSLDELSDDIGEVKTGELRYGNSVEPGDGFTGLRIAYPSMTYVVNGTATDFVLAVVEVDALQFGITLDGMVVAGDGAVIMDAAGLVANAGTIAGWIISSTMISKNGIELDSSGVINLGVSNPKIILDGVGKSVRSSNYASGLSGFNISATDGSAEFYNVLVRGGIRAAVFEKALITAFAGSQLVTPSAGVLSADYTVGGTLKIKAPPGGGWAFATGDIIQVKAETTGGVLSTFVTATRTATTNEYTTTWLNGDASATYATGATAVDWGPSGSGFVSISADGTIGSSPNISLGTHSGSPWTPSVFARLGNLNGFLGYTTNLHGLAIGDTDKYMKYDTVNGLRLKPNLFLGPGMQFATPALFHMSFDGPAPYNSNNNGILADNTGKPPTTATGGLVFRQGKYGKAVQTAEAVTNLMSQNPSFEAGTAGATPTGWANSANSAITKSADIALYGDYSGKLVASAAGVSSYATASLTLAASTTYTMSFYVWCATSGKRVLFRLADNIDRNLDCTATTVANTWVRMTATVTTDSHTAWTAVLYSYDIGTTYVDGMQVETTALATPYADGSLGVGHTWAGTAHASNSARTAANLNYTKLVPAVGSFHAWVLLGDKISKNAAYRYIADGCGSGGALIYVDNNKYLTADIGTTLVTYLLSDTNFAQNTWHQVDATWDGSSVCLYLDGALVGSGTYTSLVDDGTGWDIGSTGGTGNWSGWVDDVAVLERALTADEVYQIYASSLPILVAREGSLILGGQTGAGYIVGDSTGLYGKSADGTTQAYFGSDGKIYGGAGSVILDSAGLRITCNDTVEAKRAVSLVDTSGNALSQLYNYYDSRNFWTYLTALAPDTAKNAAMLIEARTTNTKTASILLRAVNSGGDDSIQIGYGGATTGIVMTGDTRIIGRFACNSASPQAAYASGGAVTPGAGRYGASSAANFAALATLVNNMRTALVNNGIMS